MFKLQDSSHEIHKNVDCLRSGADEALEEGKVDIVYTCVEFLILLHLDIVYKEG